MPLQINKKYKCWCGYEFEAMAYYEGAAKKSAGSNQIICPNCGRIIPTWEKELTGNVVGRKHIHIRK